MSEEIEDIIDDGQESEAVENTEEERDYEAEAIRQGWRPPSELKDPKKGVDARTFVERGEEFAPFIKAKAKEQEAKLAEYDRKFAEQEAAIERSNRLSERMLEKAKQDALEQNARERKTAWEQGDDAKYEALDKKRDTIADEFKVEPVKKAEAFTPDPHVSRFQQDNPWYGQDLILTNTANSLDASLIQTGRFNSVEARHAEVKRQIVEAFPHKFENPNRTKPNALGGGRNPAKTSTKKGWDAMPEADKKMAAGFLRGGKSKDDYATEYWKMIKEDENA